MKKILLVFGTRPEAIKMCPLALELNTRLGVQVRLCVTGQHSRMLEQAMAAFSVTADYDLAVMRESQSLGDITSAVLTAIGPVLDDFCPDAVLVHGDTTSAFAAALACFYRRIPVGHVEAGLRTHDLNTPFPEEFNRRAVDILCRWHFAPTETARENLLREGAAPETVFVTGNTVIDALKTTVRNDCASPFSDWIGSRRLLLLTAHRRENLGKPMERMFQAIRRAVEEHEDICVLYPVHMNPAVRETAETVLGSHDRIRLIDPLGVTDFHSLLSRCFLVLTDSGGIQEEATALGKPVLVMRDLTERPEGLTAGTLKLVGTEEGTVYAAIHRLLTNPAEYSQMSTPSAVYGDGNACRRIADVLCG